MTMSLMRLSAMRKTLSGVDGIGPGRSAPNPTVPLEAIPLHSYASARPHRGPGLRIATTLLLMGASVTAIAGEASADAAAMPNLQAPCGHTSVLQPVVSKAVDARAYWLDRQLLKWPGITRSGRFRLYHSANGALRAEAGAPVTGADAVLALSVREEPLPSGLASRFGFVGEGVVLALDAVDPGHWRPLLSGQLLLVQEDGAGRVVDATLPQSPGLLDDLYAAASREPRLGATPHASGTVFKLWAPTARSVSLCLYDPGTRGTGAAAPLHKDEATGIWTGLQPGDLSGRYYTYLVEVFVPGIGIVANSVTDPYSVSLDEDSKRSYVADLDQASLKPEGWNETAVPTTVSA
ncbi:MAG: hypothetical protein EOO80_16610, partial [Oxalobacteraceae bacterium]